MLNATWWPWLALNPQVRPLRSMPEKDKGEKYAVDCSRYYLGGAVVTASVSAFREDYAWNKFFYQGGWGMDEDETIFLKDAMGNRLSRRKIGQNIVSPMVNRLRGQARNVGVSATVSCIGQYARDRREAAMTEKMLLVEAAQQNPAMKAMMGDLYGVTDNESETRAFAESTYADVLERGGKQMLTFLAHLNRFDEMKEDDAERAALSGLFAHAPDLSGEHITWGRVEPDDIIWDPTAKRPDFADASWVGMCPFMDPSAIAERYGLEQGVLEKMEKALSSYNSGGYNSNDMFPQGKPRVFTVYWRDARYVERAYVMKDGDPHLCILNEEKDGVIYTDADIIKPPDNEINNRYFKGQRKVRRAYEVVRTCAFIPSEYLPVAWKRGDEKAPPDLVLDHGIYPYQEGDPYFEGGIKLPIKLTAYSYVGGRIMAPVTYARDPQRFVNQMTAAISWYVGKAGGKNKALDGYAIDPEYMSEADIQRAMKEGDPIVLNGRGMGINQAIGEYDNSPNQSLLGMFNMLQQGVAMGQASTGISDTAVGANPQPDQAVGVTNALLEQTALVNMSFFSAEVDQYAQLHGFDIEVGKQFYADRPDIMREVIGDEATAAMMLEPTARIEKYRLGVKMSMNDEALKKEAQQMALTFAAPPLQWLDQTSVGELLSTGAYPEDVAKAVLRVGKQRELAAQEQAKAQQAQAFAEATALQQQQLDAERTDYHKDMMKMAEAQDKNRTKLELPIVSNRAKAAFAEPEPATP